MMQKGTNLAIAIGAVRADQGPLDRAEHAVCLHNLKALTRLLD